MGRVHNQGLASDVTASLRMASGRPVPGRRLVLAYASGTTSWSCTRRLCTGVATRTLIKDSVTPAMLLSSLKALVGGSPHGEGLAPGRLAFIADQDRPLPYSVTRARQSRRRCSLSSSIPSGLHPTPADYAVCTSGAPMGRIHNQEPRVPGVYFMVELFVECWLPLFPSRVCFPQCRLRLKFSS